MGTEVLVKETYSPEDLKIIRDNLFDMLNLMTSLTAYNGSIPCKYLIEKFDNILKLLPVFDNPNKIE